MMARTARMTITTMSSTRVNHFHFLICIDGNLRNNKKTGKDEGSFPGMNISLTASLKELCVVGRHASTSEGWSQGIF